MLTLQNITYIHLNKDVLFENIHLSVNRQSKVALIGNNGAGKSILLKIIAGVVQPSSGVVKTDSTPYYIPQVFGQFNDLTIAQALQIEGKLNALKEIHDGNVTEANLALVNDDWNIEERCHEAMAYWKLHDADLKQKIGTLSGGQKTKVFLSGISIHQPDFILLDEPSNHLDATARNLLYDFIQSSSSTIMTVSHDRSLLQLLEPIYELSKQKITVYGGNYDFYTTQKEIETNALSLDIRSKEKALRKAKEIEREALERKQKLDARGKKKQTKEGLPTISMNTFKNNAEKSTSRMKDVHTEKINSISKELSAARETLPDNAKMKIDFNDSMLYQGKKLIEAKSIQFSYSNQLLWRQPLSFTINSGERIVIKGDNGSGKTTLIKIILGEQQPQSGIINHVAMKSIYFDQDYSLVNNTFTVFEQVQQFNDGKLQEHELKIRLNRFLFTKEYWDKLCETLSGGEKMRLLLCCLMISHQAPDMIILDEPTNNLDIQNTEILTTAIREYKGTLIIVSHDHHFVELMQIVKEIILE